MSLWANQKTDAGVAVIAAIVTSFHCLKTVQYIYIVETFYSNLPY